MKPVELLEPLARLGVKDHTDLLELIRGLERILAALGRPRRLPRPVARERDPAPPPPVESSVDKLNAAVAEAESRMAERMQQPSGRPLPEDRAEILGRRIALLLAHGDFAAARLCLDEAIAAPPAVEPAELNWSETELPLRLVNTLETHGCFRVRDVLELEDQRMLAWQHFGLAGLREVDGVLGRLGLHRKTATLNLVG